MLKPRMISDIILFMFLLYFWKGNSLNKDKFFSKYNEFLKMVSIISERQFSR